MPDPQGHDIKLNTFKTSVALKFMIVLQNLTITNRGNNGRVEYDRKLTKLDVVTARIRYRVNGVLVIQECWQPCRKWLQAASYFYMYTNVRIALRLFLSLRQNRVRAQKCQV